MDLADRIAKALTDSEVDVQRVAADCDISVQAVYAWRRGEVKNLRMENLFKVADLTGFNPRWIATGDGPEKPIQENKREELLLSLYRASDDRGKAIIHRVAESESNYVIDETDAQQRSA